MILKLVFYQLCVICSDLILFINKDLALFSKPSRKSLASNLLPLGAFDFPLRPAFCRWVKSTALD